MRLLGQGSEEFGDDDDFGPFSLSVENCFLWLTMFLYLDRDTIGGYVHLSANDSRGQGKVKVRMKKWKNDTFALSDSSD
jgi:hypothetical protein